MSVLPYTIMIGAILLSVITGIVGALGGNQAFLIVPAVIIPIIVVYFFVDRRLKAKESQSEEELVHSAEGGASGAR